MLQQATKTSVLLTHCPPNPTLKYAESIKIKKGIKKIISRGGGSTIDVAKYLAHKYHLQHVAVPTTTGTGSEVTRYSVLTVKGKKKTFEFKKPDSYILDPKFATTLPKEVTISSGLDALSQALESLWSKNATAESKLYSSVALELVLQNLPRCVKEPLNEEFRMNMLIAANMSGRAIEITKTNVCHAISYPLTDIYGIPHGIACSLSLAYFTNFFLGLNLYSWLEQFKLTDYFIDKQKIAKIAFKSPKLKDCPIKVTHRDIIKSISMV